MVAARTRESIKGWAHRDRRAQREATRDKFKLRRNNPPAQAQAEVTSFKPVEAPPREIVAQVFRPTPPQQTPREIVAQVFRPTPQHQTPRELDARKVSLERLRWDTVSILRNSRFSYEMIYERGGPCVETLTKLVDGTTQNPRLGTLISTLQICGCDLYVAPRKGAKKN